MATNASSSSKTSSSTRRSRNPDQTTTTNSGAAAEPEPSAAAPSARRAAAATTYNVRDYQNPDAGAADRPRSKAAQAKGKGATKAKGKKKDGEAPTFICFTCGKAAPKLLTCSQCHRAHYCDRECQRKDWPRHKKACRACVAAEARPVSYTHLTLPTKA